MRDRRNDSSEIFFDMWNLALGKITRLQNVRPTAENRVVRSSQSVLIHCTREIPDNGRPG